MGRGNWDVAHVGCEKTRRLSHLGLSSFARVRAIALVFLLVACVACGRHFQAPAHDALAAYSPKPNKVAQRHSIPFIVHRQSSYQ